MQAFTDTTGRKWTVSITVGTIKRVKQQTGVDVAALALDGFKKLDELLGDIVQFVDVLYLVSSVDGDKPTPEQFADCLAGDVVETACNAFIKALIDFFPNSRTRTILTKVIEKGRAVRDAGIDQVQQELDSLTVEQILKTLSKSPMS